MHAVVLTSGDDLWEMAQKVKPNTIKFFNPDMITCRTFIVAYDGDAVVGLASITEFTVWIENAIGVGYVSTHKDHRNKGVAKLIVEKLFEYAATTNRAISNTDYEPEGNLYLRHAMQRTSARYPNVTFYERDQLRR